MYRKVVDGYFTKETYFDKPLANMPYASAGTVYIKEEKAPTLKSYTTFVCKLDAAGFVQCKGTYSATTRKHITAWLKEFAPRLSYYDMKRAAEKGLAIHCQTREEKELEYSKADIYGFCPVKA